MKVQIVGSFPHIPPTEAEANADANLQPLLARFRLFQSSCRALGKALATEGATVFLGCDRDVDADTYVMAGMNDAPARDAGTKHQVVVYTPDDWRRSNPPFSNGLAALPNVSVDFRQVPGPWVKATNSIMRQVDAVVVVGGGGSTLQAGMAAPALGKTPIALAAFDGAAKQVFEVMHWSYASAGLSGQHLDALQTTFEQDAQAKRIVEAINELVKANPFRIRTGLAARCVLLTLVLICIMAWVWVLVDGSTQTNASVASRSKKNSASSGQGKRSRQQAQPGAVKSGKQGSGTAQVNEPIENATPLSAEKPSPEVSSATNPPAETDVPVDETAAAENNQAGEPSQPTVNDIGESTAHLIAILLLSALLGILFRASVRLFQNQVVKVDDIVNESAVGLLLAFTFLVLYLTGGILYEGDSLAVSPENFRRVATSVTLVGLASAIVLEAAIDEARRRLGQVIRK